MYVATIAYLDREEVTAENTAIKIIRLRYQRGYCRSKEAQQHQPLQTERQHQSLLLKFPVRKRILMFKARLDGVLSNLV